MSESFSYEDVIDGVKSAIKQAQTVLPKDVVQALEKAEKSESEDVAKSHLQAILKNVSIAKEKSIPMCQDTGIFIFKVEIGRNIVLPFNLEEALREALRQATLEIPLRPNAVHPITRHNSNDNTGVGLPDIKYSFIDEDELRVTVVPKGAGSENMSVLKMMNPTEVNSIDDFILESVFNAGGKPCPPVIVGVGVGGSFDKSAILAKTSLLRDVQDMDEEELHLLRRINSLGIGPMGMGGDTTALAVHINKAHCHTASLPVAINIQCWANRHSTVVFRRGSQWNII
ncbi:fumarate hydratase [Methanohalophilus levihalophilus]|uniref:fumarate hydratase n=1 Tax=Methanohalophilus levihalophilus TaxID=1431282 RepID=UPI001AE1D9D8|nr:fumarate hydratase [Methanohalophilus levihalophilus]